MVIVNNRTVISCGFIRPFVVEIFLPVGTFGKENRKCDMSSNVDSLQEASMVDLTYLFEEGALVDFEIDELAKLVRALFADTPLRARTLDKIMCGHPMR